MVDGVIIGEAKNFVFYYLRSFTAFGMTGEPGFAVAVRNFPLKLVYRRPEWDSGTILSPV